MVNARVARELSTEAVAREVGLSPELVLRAVDAGLLAGCVRLDQAGRPAYRITAVERLERLSK